MFKTTFQFHDLVLKLMLTMNYQGFDIDLTYIAKKIDLYHKYPRQNDELVIKQKLIKASTFMGANYKV